MKARVTCVVPARLGSTRFFGKLLTPISGKPLIAHTLERASGAGCFDRVVCLTDSAEIGRAVEAHGFDWVLTGEANNGTERIARNLDAIDAELIVNLQGDEPAFPEDGLRILRAALIRNPEWVHLLVHAEAPSPAELENPNRVKTVLDADGFVTGFARILAPHGADAPWTGARPCAPTIAIHRLQLGAYAYSRAYLERYAALPPSAAEVDLSHEILRAPGLAPLRAHASMSKHGGASVDVPDDLIAARNALGALENRPEVPTSTPMIRAQPRLQGVPA